MKKLVFLLPLLLLLTGCGSKSVTCTAQVEEDGKKYEMKMTGNLKDDKVVSGKMELIFEDKEEAEQTCALVKAFMGLASEEEQKVDIKCDGKKMIIDSLDFDSEGEEDKLTGKTKEEFINTVKAQYSDAVCK